MTRNLLLQAKSVLLPGDKQVPHPRACASVRNDIVVRVLESASAKVRNDITVGLVG